MKKIVSGSLVIILSLVTFLLLYSFEKDDLRFSNTSESLTVLHKWELPEQLKEVSAIDWLGNDKIAAVQDEEGIIFIFDLKKEAIEKQIRFGQGGDYEGLRISDNTAYVLRSDGTIFEVKDFRSASPNTTPIKTPLTKIKGIDIEGLEWDEAGNRLLLGVKEDKQKKDVRSVYSLDLGNRKLDMQPVLEIKTADPVFENGKFNPSEIAIHPKTGEYYILDARNYQLLVTDADGESKQLHHLSEKQFAKAEGLSFTPKGTLYISNEAEDGPANILQVELK